MCLQLKHSRANPWLVCDTAVSGQMHKPLSRRLVLCSLLDRPWGWATSATMAI